MAAWLDTVRLIVEEGQSRPVPNGRLTAGGKPSRTTVDYTTAKMLVTIHGKLKPDTAEHFASMALLEAISVGWKLTAPKSMRVTQW